ncbi:MAG: TolC family protein, partial [Thioalkalispiraceae bacterium]
MPRRAFVCIYAVLLCFARPAFTQEQGETLPEPLTLEYALSYADRAHPDLAMVEAEVQQAQAELLQTDAGDDLDIRLQAKAQWIDPAEESPYQDSDNHQLSLLLDKTLYDFGQQSAKQQVASSNLQSRQFNYLDARQLRRLEIIRRYFDVLLADLLFYRYNEEMATAYVRLDKLQKRQQVGQVGDLQILEQEVLYQEMRRKRTASRNNQRLTRSALAIAMGNPDLIADRLAEPDLSLLAKELPEVEELQQLALTQSPAIRALRARLNSAQQALELARNSDNPVLKAQLEAHRYARETGSTDPWRAGLVLDIPLSKGGRTDAEVARQKAKLYQVQSQLRKTEMAIQQNVLALWLEMESLKLKRDEARAMTDFSELYL